MEQRNKVGKSGKNSCKINNLACSVCKEQSGTSGTKPCIITNVPLPHHLHAGNYHEVIGTQSADAKKPRRSGASGNLLSLVNN
jgi:hypothetical protein